MRVPHVVGVQTVEFVIPRFQVERVGESAEDLVKLSVARVIGMRCANRPYPMNRLVWLFGCHATDPKGATSESAADSAWF
jgi:hypothetical protein